MLRRGGYSPLLAPPQDESPPNLENLPFHRAEIVVQYISARQRTGPMTKKAFAGQPVASPQKFIEVTSLLTIRDNNTCPKNAIMKACLNNNLFMLVL